MGGEGVYEMEVGGAGWGGRGRYDMKVCGGGGGGV